MWDVAHTRHRTSSNTPPCNGSFRLPWNSPLLSVVLKMFSGTCTVSVAYNEG